MILDLPGTEGITIVRCMGTNCYLIEMVNGVMVVDAGWRSGPDAVLKELRKIGFQPKDITLIILTHAHFDHFKFALELKKQTGAQIAAHLADVQYFEKGGLGIFPSHISAKLTSMGRRVENWFHAPPVVIDLVLEDGDLLKDWRVCHTPGHTPGTISLFAENRKVLITGGWAIPGKTATAKRSWIKTLVGFISVDPKELEESCEYLARLDFQTLLCSHFRPQLFPHFAKRLKSLAG